MFRNSTPLPDKDQLLIKNCIAGDKVSQSKLYNSFMPEMMGLCLRYSANRQEAEEILQEGFVRVFKYIHKFKGTGSLKSWIRKIMVNCALTKYRDKSHLYPVIQIDSTDHGILHYSPVTSGLEAKDVMKLVQSLPARYRMVFNLYVFEGMKHKEIAEALGITEGTSKSNLFDARSILQKALTTKKIASL